MAFNPVRIHHKNRSLSVQKAILNRSQNLIVGTCSVDSMSALDGRRAAAINSFAAAILKLMNDPHYEHVISSLAQISNILLRIDSQVPGATDALLTSILADIPP
jgi:hypothetical protein